MLSANRDFKLTAEEAWKEYDQNTAAANKKYRGKFVQVTGKLHIYKTEKATQFFLEAPSQDAKWSIIFLPHQKDAPSLKDGQDITIRGRFLARKEPDGHLAMSNCTILKEK